MSNMENAHSEDMQFDDTDLISACSAKQVPPQKPVQTVYQPKRLTNLYVYRIFTRLVGNIISFYLRI